MYTFELEATVISFDFTSIYSHIYLKDLDLETQMRQNIISKNIFTSLFFFFLVEL